MGCNSCNGVGPIAKVEGRIKGSDYIRLLSKHLLPYMQSMVSNYVLWMTMLVGLTQVWSNHVYTVKLRIFTKLKITSNIRSCREVCARPACSPLLLLEHTALVYVLPALPC